MADTPKPAAADGALSLDDLLAMPKADPAPEAKPEPDAKPEPEAKQPASLSFDDLMAMPKPQAKPERELNWSEVPGMALENAPESAVELAKGVVQPIIHPVETAKALWGIGKGGASKLANATGLSHDTPEERAQNEAQLDAMGAFFKQRYGSVAGVKAALAHDPVGVAADAAAVLSPATMARRLPGAAGRAAEVVSNVSRTIDPVNLALRATARVAGPAVRMAGRRAADLLGVQSGTSGAAVRAASEFADNPTFNDHLRGRAPVEEVADMAQSAVRQAAADRQAVYQADMAATRGNQRPLSYANIDQAVADAEASVSYHGVTKNQAAADVVRRMRDLVELWKAQPPTVTNGLVNWPFRTAIGLDALKQAMTGVWETTQQGSTERRVADQIRHAITSEITRQAPSYAEAMAHYAQASDVLRDLTKTFSLGERSSTDTALRKLQSIMRNNVNTNYGYRAQLADILAHYEPNLRPALAGQQLSSWEPRGLARISLTQALASIPAAVTHGLTGAAAMAPLLAFSSPRFTGEAVAAATRAARQFTPGRLRVAGDVGFQAGRAAEVAPAGPDQPPAAPNPDAPPLPRELRIRQEAHAAIARGVPRDKVIERMQKMGVDPGGI